MNRFVSLLLVAFSLTAIGLTRPAQAQAQWVKGLAYFSNGNTQSPPVFGTTVMATLNTNKASSGHVSVLSTEPVTGTYTTSGSYRGSVGVYYVWTGSGGLTRAMNMGTTQSLEATGAGPGAASSYAGGYYGASGSVSAGYNSGWDSTTSSRFSYVFGLGVTPPSENQTASLGASTSIYASGLGSTVVTATVTFGDPIVSYPGPAP